MLQWFVTEQMEEEAAARAVLGRIRLAGNTGVGLLMIDQELAAGNMPGMPAEPAAAAGRRAKARVQSSKSGKADPARTRNRIPEIPWQSDDGMRLSKGRCLRARCEPGSKALGYRVARYTYEPGTLFPDHTHGVHKIDAVISGRFRLVVGGHLVVLGPGDWVEIPRGAVHSATVLGDEPVVALDAIRMEGA